MALDKLVTRETLKTVVGEVVTEQEQTYAKQDGYYDTLHAGSASVADNLSPYSADSGEAQDIPFILQGTACGNGETQVDTGSFAQIKGKRGNSVVVNQFVDTTDTSVTLTNGHKYFTFIDGVYSAVNGTGQSVEVDGSTDKVVDLTQWFG